MWNMALPWWEFILRALIVYVFMIALLKISGKRQIGQLAPFDLVLLLILSNAVQNSMNGGDNSVSGGMLSASTLVALNYGVGYLVFKSKKFERLLEGSPPILIHNGKINEAVMRGEKLTHHELDAALRAAGCVSAGEVHIAILENNGQISVHPKREKE